MNKQIRKLVEELFSKSKYCDLKILKLKKILFNPNWYSVVLSGTWGDHQIAKIYREYFIENDKITKTTLDGEIVNFDSETYVL